MLIKGEQDLIHLHVNPNRDGVREMSSASIRLQWLEAVAIGMQSIRNYLNP
jgi:hypothetical protein